MSYISIHTPDGDFNAYVAIPEAGSGPGIVVIQEIFGVNANIRGIADRIAEKGYVAICPDLFWRIEPGVDITDKTEAEWAKAFELFGKFDADKGTEDIQAAISALRNHKACTGKVGVIGYCLGGKMAYLAATRTDADASIGYYGVGIQDMLDEATNITNPLMLHIAGLDQFVPPDAQSAIEAGIGRHKHVTLHIYPDDDHAFAREGGEHYSAQSASIADQRSFDLLTSVLDEA